MTGTGGYARATIEVLAELPIEVDETVAPLKGLKAELTVGGEDEVLERVSIIGVAGVVPEADLRTE